MKNILKNYIYLSLFFVLSLVLSSCSDDDSLESDAPKVVPLVTDINGEAVAFVEDVREYSAGPSRGGSEYVWTLTGPAAMQPVTGKNNAINITFNEIGDVSLSVFEKAANGSTSDAIAMDIDVFGKPCTYTLVTHDTYGDGWNGGVVRVITQGITTDYREDDGVDTVFEINISNEAEFSIEYISGGGTGGGPGWESENWFELTAPDGTVWTEGSLDYSGVPTEGIIVEGTNICP